MQEISPRPCGMFGEAAAAVMVYEKQGRTADDSRQRGGSAKSMRRPSRCPTEHSFAELVIQQNRTACAQRRVAPPRPVDLARSRPAPFQAVLCAPMQRAGQAFGAVAIYSGQRQEWTAEQFRLAEWLAAQCAQILETLRMQQELAAGGLVPDAQSAAHRGGRPRSGRSALRQPGGPAALPRSRSTRRGRSPLAGRLAGGRSRRCRAGRESVAAREVAVDDRFYHQTIHFSAGDRANPHLRHGHHRAQAGGRGVAGGGKLGRAGQGRRRTGQPRQGPFPGGPQPRTAHAADAGGDGRVDAPGPAGPGPRRARDAGDGPPQRGDGGPADRRPAGRDADRAGKDRAAAAAPSSCVRSSSGRSRSASPTSRPGGCTSAWTWGRPLPTGSRPTSPGSSRSSGTS